MNRRETIKSLLLGSVAAGMVLNGCTPNDSSIDLPELTKGGLSYGRTPDEIKRDTEVLEEVFFNEHELATIAVLCDIILPKNSSYGSATDTGVPEFIKFIVKDLEYNKTPIRGGLMWLDSYSNKLYNKKVVTCSEKEQFYICDQIAYPEKTIPELKQGEKFFTIMRNLTLTGYFTSKIGIEDLGYKGNMPNVWDGVPEEILKEHGMKYDEVWMTKCVDQTKRGDIAVWDAKGNLIS